MTVARVQGQGWTEAVMEALDERVKVVSVPNVHWTDGAALDLDAVAERAHALGCTLVIDASQSAGAMPLDAGRLRPDFLISVGYKWLLGPFGLVSSTSPSSTAAASRWSTTGSLAPVPRTSAR